MISVGNGGTQIYDNYSDRPVSACRSTSSKECVYRQVCSRATLKQGPYCTKVCPTGSKRSNKFCPVDTIPEVNTILLAHQLAEKIQAELGMYHNIYRRSANVSNVHKVLMLIINLQFKILMQYSNTVLIHNFTSDKKFQSPFNSV